MSDSDTNAPDRPTPAELRAIEVTPAMLEAGLHEYTLFESCDPGYWIVTAIYRGMEAARRATAEKREDCIRLASQQSEVSRPR